MITINGLTLRQKNIMDLLWGCESIEQVNTLVQALPTKQDQQDAQSLIIIATWDTIEEELGLDAYSDQVSDLISRCR
jgi:hypothetical protein